MKILRKCLIRGIVLLVRLNEGREGDMGIEYLLDRIETLFGWYSNKLENEELKDLE